MKAVLAFSLATLVNAKFPSEWEHDGAFASDWEGIEFGLEGSMSLYMMEDKMSAGAVCLDGTPAGFYYSNATTTGNANDWQIYFEGGGWCYDDMDCWGRSSTLLGSSTHWAPTVSPGGIMSDSCSVNPDFCNFNRVYIAYCDGNSFTGNRDEPLVVQGKPLYFRGRRIIDAVLQTLMTMGLNKAKRVLLTGCSAGGLATYLHTDYVNQWLKTNVPSLQVFKAAPISGFFLDQQTIEGKPVYEEQIRNIWQIANSTNGVNDACVAHYQPTGDQWKCNFAPHTYPFIQTPIFPLNSAYDAWQTKCIYASELVPGFPNPNTTQNSNCNAIPAYQNCVPDPDNCTAPQMVVMNKYIDYFNAAMQSAGTYSKDGNGAFIHSCLTHCEAQNSNSWLKFSVNNVTMQEAVSKWWAGSNGPAINFEPCHYKTGPSGPRDCNPSCV